MFRRKFYVDKLQGTAKLYVCSLGYGYVYINGHSITKDIFTAPVSNYNKTIWYNTYSVTEFLKPGNNIIAIWCGNG